MRNEYSFFVMIQRFFGRSDDYKSPIKVPDHRFQFDLNSPPMRYLGDPLNNYPVDYHYQKRYTAKLHAKIYKFFADLKSSFQLYLLSLFGRKTLPPSTDYN